MFAGVVEIVGVVCVVFDVVPKRSEYWVSVLAGIITWVLSPSDYFQITPTDRVN